MFSRLKNEHSISRYACSSLVVYGFLLVELKVTKNADEKFVDTFLCDSICQVGRPYFSYHSPVSNCIISFLLPEPVLPTKLRISCENLLTNF